MENRQKMVNRNSQDRRRLDPVVWDHEERRKKEEVRSKWKRAGKWRSIHKPIKEIDLSQNALL